MRKYEVWAENIEDFCNRYHQRRLFHELGEDYVESDIEAHKKEFSRYGFTIIPKGTSVTGDVVTWYGKKGGSRRP